MPVGESKGMKVLIAKVGSQYLRPKTARGNFKLIKEVCFVCPLQTTALVEIRLTVKISGSLECQLAQSAVQLSFRHRCLTHSKVTTYLITARFEGVVSLL